MEKRALLAFLSLWILACVIAMALYWCWPGDWADTVEKVPEIAPLTNFPALERYALEFPQLGSEPRRRPEAFLSFDPSLIQGNVGMVDHNTNCSLWLFLTYSGSNYYDGQKLHLYSDESNRLDEITAYSSVEVSQAFVLSEKNGESPFILASVCPTNAKWWDKELRTNKLHASTARRMTSGGACHVSPDHLKVAFWRQNGAGFHSLHMWVVGAACIDDVISMWESDPGSGTSWYCHWSADSKALNIRGTSRGFYRDRQHYQQEFNLLYVVEDKRMFSLPRE